MERGGIAWRGPVALGGKITLLLDFYSLFVEANIFFVRYEMI